MALRTHSQLCKKLWIKLFKAVTYCCLYCRLRVFERHIGYQSPFDRVQKIVWRDSRCVPPQRSILQLVLCRAHDLATTRNWDWLLFHFHSFHL